jgi:hypothetical protein
LTPTSACSAASRTCTPAARIVTAAGAATRGDARGRRSRRIRRMSILTYLITRFPPSRPGQASTTHATHIGQPLRTRHRQDRVFHLHRSTTDTDDHLSAHIGGSGAAREPAVSYEALPERGRGGADTADRTSARVGASGP